jgi:putative phosphoesterase
VEYSGAAMRLLVIADTHIPDFARRLPAAILDEAATSDLVIHAGDVTTASVLGELSQRAPVHAVRGNNDLADVSAYGAAETLELEIEGVPVAVVHDAGPTRGRPSRMRRRFPQARLLFFGHSHIPMDVEEDGLRLVNPGSPTWKRRQPNPTYAVVTIGRSIAVDIRRV